MSLEDFGKAILAFLLGLAAKFIYDLWKERRERKILVFKKTITSSFALNTLEEEIRDETFVFFQGHQVQSIHFFRLDLDNKGLKPTKNQSFTVRFGKDATILGEPTSLSSSEDMRHIELDNTSIQNNSRRFLIKLLQGNRRLSWNFGVINHNENDFIVEHGVIGSGEELDKADLDVISMVTTESVSPDLTDRITRLVSFLIIIVVLSLISESISYSLFNSGLTDIFRVIMNVGIIGLWILVLREISFSIPLFMQWLEQRKEYRVGGDYISVSQISDSRGVSIGQSASSTVNTQPIGVDYEQMQELLLLLGSPEDGDTGFPIGNSDAGN